MQRFRKRHVFTKRAHTEPVLTSYGPCLNLRRGNPAPLCPPAPQEAPEPLGWRRRRQGAGIRRGIPRPPLRGPDLHYKESLPHRPPPSASQAPTQNAATRRTATPEERSSLARRRPTWRGVRGLHAGGAQPTPLPPDATLRSRLIQRRAERPPHAWGNPSPCPPWLTWPRLSHPEPPGGWVAGGRPQARRPHTVTSVGTELSPL